MLFAGTELAARIEHAEARLTKAAAQTALDHQADGSGCVFELGSAVAAFTSVGSPFNKLIGVGFGDPLSEEVMADVEHLFQQHDAPVQAEVSTLADPSVLVTLSRRGYQLVGFEHVLGLRLPTTGPMRAPAAVEVELSGSETLERWIKTVAAGFAQADAQGVPSSESFPPEAIADAMRDFARAPGTHRYAAFRRGVLAGGASLRIDDRVAQLCGAATLPEHRRQGVQSALLARRLEDAASAGCDVAVVTTQPGSKSHQNVQRIGFELLYARAVLHGPGAPL